MLDAYITAMNTQYTASKWIDSVSENMMNVYTPGYRAKKFQFKTFLDGSIGESYIDVKRQGKAIPALADENLFIEGRGYFALRNDLGQIVYTRFGDFKFDGDGVYRSKNGDVVQGYLVNEQGQIMNGIKAEDVSKFSGSEFASFELPSVPVKLWIDPVNGRYLGKYEEFEIKEDGILYGKADSGSVCTPLYKIAAVNFNNPEGLYEIQPGRFIETENSGKAVIGNAKIKGKALEQSNVDFTEEINWYQQGQFQLSIADMITKQHRELLEQVMGLIGQ